MARKGETRITRVLQHIPVCLVLLATFPCSAQQELSAHQRKAIRGFYEQEEGRVRREVEAKIEMFIKHGEARNKRALTPEEIDMTRFFLNAAEYQKLIELLKCIEEGAKNGGGQSFAETCYEEQLRYAVEMFSFIGEYAPLNYPLFSKCQAKTRLFQLEMQYPPYAFMLTNRAPEPMAIDAKPFLECVKSNL